MINNQQPANIFQSKDEKQRANASFGTTRDQEGGNLSKPPNTRPPSFLSEDMPNYDWARILEAPRYFNSSIFYTKSDLQVPSYHPGQYYH
jgi:hypothetical protein